MTKLSFKPKQVVDKFLKELPERGRDILIKRYGLGKDTNKMTLEAIGGIYGITRERVRQIEDASIENIRKSSAYDSNSDVFIELTTLIHKLGVVVSEKDLLEDISANQSTQNLIHFMLVIGNPFYKNKENKNFYHRWYVDEEITTKVEDSIRNLYKSLKNDEIIAESEILNKFLEHLQDVSEEYKNEEVLKRWLSMSKDIDKNPLGDWGKSNSSNINIKGIRDYAYLVIRKHGSPIHFREVAESISKIFGKKAHVATTHNELIKDPRFVLVGRGLYALTEWGYSTGVVRDVIRDILNKNGPMTKEEIIEKVLKERHVKENTILVNLQNNKIFEKDVKGRYKTV